MKEIEKWCKENSWEKWSENEWRNLVDYAEYIFDRIYIDDDKFEFSWEEWYWGGIEYKNREFDNFEEFKEFYNNLKD
jgi:hypothetical protein